MAILDTVTDAISSGLNRNVSNAFSEFIIRLYKQNGSKSDFSAAASALGFLETLSGKIYTLINDNVEELEKLDGNLHQQAKVQDDLPKLEKPKPKKPKLVLDFDDELDTLDTKPEKTNETKFKKKLTFKKIKKEDAQRIKAPVKTDTPKEEKTLERRQEKITTVTSSRPEEVTESVFAPYDDAMYALDQADDLENDRDWYTQEESAYAAVSQYEDLDDEVRTFSKPKHRKPASLGRAGGGFDADGNYVDYDHDNSTISSSIPILSHFLVPHFLKKSQEHLILQGDRTTRSLGPSISPVRDPSSELAILARTGSAVVKELKEKKEKSQQAKDRSGVLGAIASVLRLEENSEQSPKSTGNQAETPPNFDQIQAQRKSLPAYTCRDELLQIIGENQIVVVIGETGSGKTTQLTQFLCEEYGKNMEKDGVRSVIGCTQPRRVAAMSVAKRVAEEVGCKLGEEVGYSIRFEDRTSTKKTKIKYLTEGILLREMLADPNLENYACIIMDEAHERTLNTDILLGLFRKLLRRRRDLKLVVTSATMNADRFTRFFGDAPQYFIPGRTFPVDVFYSRTACTDYVETTVKQVVTIHLANKVSDGDILVFMTGQEDIEAVCELIEEKLQVLENPPPLDIFPIYSTMPQDLQKRIFNKQNSLRRKCVVATNIAETSLTVDGVKYVVDCGLVKMKMFNAKLGMDALQVVPISHANAQQRSGRAGRTGPGIAYRLYTEKAASPAEMYVQPIPEIQRANLSSVMLMLKLLNVQDVILFPFLDAPPKDLLACSLYDLWAMGALDNAGNLTEMGAQLTLFPMEPNLAKLILLSCDPKFHCSLEIISIVAMLSVPNVFYRPKERANEADAAREKFLVADLDHLTLLSVFVQWEQRGQQKHMTPQKLASWSTKNFVHHRLLVRASDIRNQILLILQKNKLPLLKAKNDSDIRKCLCAAYFHQLAKLVKMNGGGRGFAEYANLRQSYMKMYLHPTSALVGGTEMSPQYVVYDELVLTTKEYMQCATAVEPEWLLEFGYLFFTVNSSVRKKLNLDFVVDRKQLEEALEKEEETVEEKKTETRRVKMRRF